MRRSRAWLFALPVLGGLLVLLTGKRTDPGAGVVRTPNTSTPAAPLLGRAAVVAAAVSQLGNDDPAPYWSDVLPGKDPTGMDWCGAFALWCFAQARYREV